jgi:hypothetical protein
MNATAFAGISPTILGVHRAADIVAALTPPAATAGAALAPVSGPSLTSKVTQFAPGVGGALAGAYVWKRHRILGLLAGHAVVNSAWDFYRGDRKRAVCNAIVEGAGVLGALNSRKIPVIKGGPITGYVAGVLLGAVATYFVEGSPVRQAVANFRK